MSEKRETEDEEKIVEERFYTIPLKQAWIAPIKKRTPRGLRLIKGFVKKHMKVEDPVITQEVNEHLWKMGIEGLPRRIRVRITRNADGVVKVRLAKGE